MAERLRIISESLVPITLINAIALMPSHKKKTQAASSPPPPPASSGFSVLFCRLYFIATSGVCLIRSGTVGFQKKLQSHKKKFTNAKKSLSLAYFVAQRVRPARGPGAPGQIVSN